jgi:two-component system, LuxR family, response regulator FixJ
MSGVSTRDREGICLSSQYVHVVDDDREVRRSLSFMLGSAQFNSRPFASGSDLVESLDELQPGCVLPVAVRAMKAGAVDFLEKPFEEEVLLGSLERAFGLLRERGETAARRRGAEARVGLLTLRERELLRGLMAGMSNKMLSRRLDISLRTVEMHRANMMERLQVGSLAEALTLAVQAGVEPLAEE